MITVAVGHDWRMLYAYIDESYSDNGFYYVGVLVVTQEQGSCVASKLNALAAQVSRDYGVPAAAEFHGYNMFHYCEDWAALRGKAKVSVGIYRAAMRIIDECEGKLFFHGLDVNRQILRYGANAYPAHIVALQYVLEEVNKYARSIGETVTVIADQVPDQKAHEARINRFQRVGTMGYKRSYLETIQMPFAWEDSRSHRNLQAVDMATFIYRRYDSHRETSEMVREAVLKIWKTILGATRHHRVWIP